jgi:hypothetical protein
LEEDAPKTEETLSLADRLWMIERLEAELTRKAAALVEKGTSISHSDLFIFGAVNRTLAQSKGFRDLINTRNFPCAAAILRMQLDTAMRVNAMLLVEDRNTFCEAILGERRFNTLRDAAGNRLTDAHRRKKLAENHPWIETIYTDTSDFIHLSGRHFYNSIANTNNTIKIVTLYISGNDPPNRESVYFDVVDAFFKVSRMLALLLLGYFVARAEVLAASGKATRG